MADPPPPSPPWTPSATWRLRTARAVLGVVGGPRPCWRVLHQLLCWVCPYDSSMFWTEQCFPSLPLIHFYTKETPIPACSRAAPHLMVSKGSHSRVSCVESSLHLGPVKLLALPFLLSSSWVSVASGPQRRSVHSASCRGSCAEHPPFLLPWASAKGTSILFPPFCCLS